MSRNVDSVKSDIFLMPYIFHVFQGPGPSFRSNLIKLHFKKKQVQIRVDKESNILVYVIIILSVYFSLNEF